MKWTLISLGIIDAFLVMAAVVRLMTATPDTPTLLSDFTGARKAPSAQATTARGSQDGFGETGQGAQVVEHLRANRVDEITETGTLSTSEVQGNTEYSASGSLDRAATITGQREEDLDDAKKKIGKIGK